MNNKKKLLILFYFNVKRKFFEVYQLLFFPFLIYTEKEREQKKKETYIYRSHQDSNLESPAP